MLRRTLLVGVLIAILSGGIAALGNQLFYMHWLRSAAGVPDAPAPRNQAFTMDRELRALLPPGSPRPIVETVLRSRRLGFHFTPSRDIVVLAASDHTRGDPQNQPDLLLQFHFDQHALLKSIDSQTVYSNQQPR